MGGYISCIANALFAHRKVTQMEQLENVMSDDDEQCCAKKTAKKKLTRMVEIVWHGHAKTAQLSGDFNRWLVTEMRRVGENEFRLDVIAKSTGITQFKFIIDGRWCVSHNYAQCDNGLGGHNNYITAAPIDSSR